LTPQLEQVKARVQEAVNREVQERIRTRYGGVRLKYQSPGPWIPNAAFVNCYNGPQESVGWVCISHPHQSVPASQTPKD
jgi:hypothetical protein